MIDYNLKEAEKGLTPSRYEGIVARLRETWGRDAGWVQETVEQQVAYLYLHEKYPVKAN